MQHNSLMVYCYDRKIDTARHIDSLSIRTKQPIATATSLSIIPSYLHSRSTLLLRHTHSPSSPPCSLTVLTPHPQSPIMSQTTMRPDFLQPLQILAQLTVHSVGEDLGIFAVDDVALTIEEPRGDFVLRWVLDDGYYAFEFFRGDVAGSGCLLVILELVSWFSGSGFWRERGCGCGNGSRILMERSRMEIRSVRVSACVCVDLPLVQVYICFLADQVGIATSYALYLGKGVHDLLLAIDVGVEQSEDELEVRLLA